MDPAPTLTDDPLTRELECALAVEPSPEFAARVRAQIANESMHPVWRWWLPLSATGWLAAVALVGLAFWLPRGGSAPPSPVQDTAASALPSAMEPAAEPAPPAPVVPVVNEPSVPQSTMGRTPGRAFREAVPARARDTTPGTRRVENGTTSAAPMLALEPMRALVIEPLHIERLASLTPLEGERQ